MLLGIRDPICETVYKAVMPLSATLPRKNCSSRGIVVSRNPPQAPPRRRIQGDGRGVAFLIHVNGVMFTLTLAQHIIRRADVHGTQSVASRVIGMSDSMYRKWMQASRKDSPNRHGKSEHGDLRDSPLTSDAAHEALHQHAVEAVFLQPAEVPQYGFAIPRRVDARRFVGR